MQSPHHALRTVQRVLMPLARLLIAHGVSFTEFVEAAKRSFIAAAQQQSSEPLNDSRLHALTGIHRRDVRRLREPEPEERNTLTSVPFYVWARWGTDEAYLDARGASLPLPRSAPEGEPSFDALVESVTRNVRPRAVLEMLLQLGMVHLADDERVERVPQLAAVSPKSGVMLDAMAMYGYDRLSATVDNVLGGRGVHYITALHSEAINAADIDELRRTAVATFDPTMNRFNKDMARAETRAAKAPHAPQRMSLSVIMYSEPIESAAASGRAAATSVRKTARKKAQPGTAQAAVDASRGRASARALPRASTGASTGASARSQPQPQARRSRSSAPARPAQPAPRVAPRPNPPSKPGTARPARAGSRKRSPAR